MEEWGCLLGGRELSAPITGDGMKGGRPEPGLGGLTENPGPGKVWHETPSSAFAGCGVQGLAPPGHCELHTSQPHTQTHSYNWGAVTRHRGHDSSAYSSLRAETYSPSLCQALCQAVNGAGVVAALMELTVGQVGRREVERHMLTKCQEGWR